MHLERFGRLAHRREPGAHARDVAVVVGAEDVDQLVEAALALVEVIGDVGGEIGVLAVLAHDHAVLLVAELGRAEPVAPSCSNRWPCCAQALERAVDRPPSCHRARPLGRPAVEAARRTAARSLADVGEHRRERERRARCGSRPSPSSSCARAMSASMCFSLSPPCGRVGRQPVEDVVRGPCGACSPCARAALSRDRRAHSRPDSRSTGTRGVSPQQLEIAQPDADREDVHLPAGIVDVVLAVHVVAGGLEQVGERRADRRPAAVADVQRAGRIRRHELDDHLAAARRPCSRRSAAPSVVHARDLRLHRPRASGRN